MQDESTETITIKAQPAVIRSVIADFPRYPTWAESIRECQVVKTHRDGSAAQVRFVVDAGMFRDDYVLAYTWSPLRVDWTLVSSEVQRSQVGSYTLTPAEDGTLVTYRLAVGLTIPLLAAFRRRAEQSIMETALRSLKTRVECSGKA